MDKLFLPKGFQDVLWLEKELKQRTAKEWDRRGEKRALELFHAMAERVPAYKDFLQKQKINHRCIKSIEDFKTIPPIDKDNYLRVYPRPMLCWDGDFKSGQWTISTTSGSTGKPFYFPRGLKLV